MLLGINIDQVNTYLITGNHFLDGISVTSLHICSVEALFGRHGSRHYVYAYLGVVLGRNTGQCIAHIFGRGASSEKYRSNCYIFGH